MSGIRAESAGGCRVRDGAATVAALVTSLSIEQHPNRHRLVLPIARIPWDHSSVPAENRSATLLTDLNRAAGYFNMTEGMGINGRVSGSLASVTVMVTCSGANGATSTMLQRMMSTGAKTPSKLIMPAVS